METIRIDRSDDIDAELLAVEVADFCVGTPEVSAADGQVTISAERITDFPRLSATVQSHRSVTTTELQRLMDHARQVWLGQATFTPAQVQKILAGLVLTRRR